jgi:glycosyltransferase involved in cell wall biosynthesis
MRKRLSEILPTLKPDIVYFSRYAGSQYATESSDSLQIVDQHDLSSNLWRISSRNADSFAVRLFSKFNLAITSQYERRIFGRVDGIVCVSNDEHEMTKRLVEAEKQMIVIPNGADVDYFSPANCDTDPATTVLFGAMSAIRNVQAAEYFARRVLPMIQHTHPDARFEIVGHNPASEVLALSRLRGVEVTGEVSDIRPYLARATVVVAPYFSGSGVKHKVPIAMAMAKASVLSTNAAQGLGICHGMHALVADETSEFASAVCRLLSDTEQRTRLGLAARELIVNQYSWDALAGKLERWLIQRHAERFGFEANRHNLLL